MTRYVFCVLIGVLLVLRLHYSPRIELQENRMETETLGKDAKMYIDNQYHISNYISTTVVSQLQEKNCDGNQFFEDGISLRGVSGGVLAGSILFRNLFHSKSFKYDLNGMTLWVRNFFCDQPAEKRKIEEYPDTNYIKYHYRYYIYNLRHILI